MKLKKKITNKTKAIIVVHFLGNPIEMKLLNKISKKYNLKVIEDAAEAHGAEIEGQKLVHWVIVDVLVFMQTK